MQTAFPYFKKNQVRKILEIIEAIPLDDYFISEQDGKKNWKTNFGLNKYRYMQCIPYVVIEAAPMLKKAFNEFKRRYPEAGILQSRATPGGMVKPPLPENVYSKMGFKAWLSSFHKFNEERGIKSWDEDFLKGGRSEHASVFRTCVKKEPERFLPLIAHLFTDLTVSITYSLSALEALTESSYDPITVTGFLKALIKRQLDPNGVRTAIRTAGYLIRNDVHDREIIDFLILKALFDPDPDINDIEPENKSEQLLSKGLYSIRGAAVHTLIFIKSPGYDQEIFQILTQVANQDSIPVISALLYRFAYLTNLNRNKAFDLFVSILNRRDHTFSLEAAWSLSYLIHDDFRQLVPYFHCVLQCELTDKEAEAFGNVLFGAYYQDYEAAKELLDILLIKFPKVQSRIVLNALQYIHMKPSSLRKSLDLMEQYVLSTDKELLSAFHTAFLHVDHIEFKELFPFILKYAHTTAIGGGEYFLAYLLVHCHAYPDECINVFEIVSNNTTEIEHSALYYHGSAEHALNLIIGIYNSLRPLQNPKHEKYQQKLLTLFDATLRDVRFKSNTDKLLDKIMY